MKKLVLLSAVAAALTFATSRTMAAGGDVALNASGSVKYQSTLEDYSGTVASHSFNEKTVYLIISNAVANASTTSDGLIPSTTLPANGYIAYSPETYDTNADIYGIFYVTNSSGVYYPLSGLDTNGNYYNWIELDTATRYGQELFANLGYSQYFDVSQTLNNILFDYIAVYKISTNSKSSSYGTGPVTSTSTALLYIHDDPYLYDDTLNPYEFMDTDAIVHNHNENAFEIRGILTGQFTIKDFNATAVKFTLTGTGNFILDDYEFFGVVTSGHASL